MEKRLERDESNKMLAGVAAGLANYLNIEVTWVRIIFLCMTIFGLSGLWIYLILWIAVPAKPIAFGSFETDYKVFNEAKARSSMESGPAPIRVERDGRGRLIAGIFLVVLGSVFLFDEFVDLPEWVSFAKLWPLIFVAIGVIILFKPERKQARDNDFGNFKQTSFENDEANPSTSEDKPLA